MARSYPTTRSYPTGGNSQPSLRVLTANDHFT